MQGPCPGGGGEDAQSVADSTLGSPGSSWLIKAAEAVAQGLLFLPSHTAIAQLLDGQQVELAKHAGLPRTFTSWILAEDSLPLAQSAESILGLPSDFSIIEQTVTQDFKIGLKCSPSFRMECGIHAEPEDCRGPSKKLAGVGLQSNVNSLGRQSLGRQRGDHPVGLSLGSVEAEVGCELGTGRGKGPHPKQ